MRINIASKTLLIALIPLSFELIFCLVLGTLLLDIEKQQSKVESYRKTVTLITAIQNDIFDSFRHLHGFAQSKDLSYVESIKKTEVGFNSRVKKLRRLYQNRDSQIKKLDEITYRCKRWFSMIDFAINRLKKTVKPEQAVSIMMELTYGETTIEVESFRKSILRLHEDESERITLAGNELKQAKNNLVTWLIGGLTANLFLAGGLALYFARQISSRVASLLKNMERYTTGEELSEQLNNIDELGEIDNRFRQMIDQLELAKTKEESIFENTLDVLCSIDTQGCFTHLNQASERLFGYVESELVNEPVQILFPDQKSGNNFLKQMEKASDNNESVSFESLIKRKDGELIYVLWSINWSHHDESYFAVCHDITTRKQIEKLLKQSEEQLKKIIQGIHVGIVQLDSTGRVKFINSAAQSLIANDNQKVIGESFKEFLHSNYKFEGQSPTTKEEEVQLEYRSNKEPFVALTMGSSPISDRENSDELVTLIDITERVKTEQLKEEFIAMVSHDLKAPLASIQAFLEMASDGSYDSDLEKLKTRSKSTFKTAYSMCELLQNMLDLEKLEQSTKLQIESKVSEELIEQVLISLEPLIMVSNLDIEKKIESFECDVDEIKVTRVLTNLIYNAINYSTNNGTITVGCKQENETVFFYVENEGEAIPLDVQKSIFEKYNQGTGAKKIGSGLGLTICKEFIDALGGNIGVKSDDQRTQFWFSVPSKLS